MDKNIAKKWVKALRSGKYKKGIGQLKNKKDEYCCLGVLCDLSGKPWNGLDGLPPKDIDVWAGFKSRSYNFSKKYKVKHSKSEELTFLNDQGLSFKQIANLIENNYEDL